MRLFSEKVDPTFTSSDLNILTVKSFEEAFFDVYEFEINGKKFIAEKKSEYNGSPVVDIPVVIGEEEFVAPFVLYEGEFSVQFNKSKKTYIGSSSDNVPEIILEDQEEEAEIKLKDVPSLIKELNLEEGTQASKMIFDQRVEVSLSNYDHNILIVDNFDEVYFDIYELKINDKIYNAEKISEYKGRPVVNIPIVFENKEYIAPFVLEEGPQEIFFNEKNLQFVKKVEAEKLELPEIEEEAVEDIVFEKKEDILQDIAKAKKLAKQYAENIKQKKIEEANSTIKSNEQRIKSYLKDIKEDLTGEFITIVEKANIDLKENTYSRANNLTSYIKTYVEKESDNLLNDLEKLNENSVQHFEAKIQELVKNIYTNNLTKLINEKNDDNISRYSKLFKNTKTSLEELLNENKEEVIASLDDLKGKVDSDIITLEKSNVVLEDKFQRGLNKALSRAGNIKTDTLKEVDSRIKVTEGKITDIYDVTLNEVSQQLDKRVQDVSFINEQIKDLTKTSKSISLTTQEDIKDVKDDILKLKVEKGLLEEKITESKALLDSGIEKLNKLNKNIAKENKIYIEEEVDRLTKYGEKSAQETADKLDKFNENVTKHLQEAKQYINKEIDSFDSSISKLKKSNTESSKRSTKKINIFKESIVKQLQDTKDSIHKEVQDLDISIVNLEKTNTEINDKISKSEKAVRQDFFDSIDNTEQILTSLVESKLKDTNTEINDLLTKKLKNVDNKFKEQLTSKIEESKVLFFREVKNLESGFSKTIKNKLLTEVRQLKDFLPAAGQDKKGLVNKNEKIDVPGIKRELESTLMNRFNQESLVIRKFLDSYGGGGGSVAMQFADGGTMRGDLTVQGTISASGGIVGGSSNTEIISKGPGLAEYAVIDTFAISDMTAGKYAFQVQSDDGQDNPATYFGEVSVTTDGTNVGVVEYGLNYTTAENIVEFGAVVNSGTVSLTAKGTEFDGGGPFQMQYYTFKGNRINLF